MRRLLALPAVVVLVLMTLDQGPAPGQEELPPPRKLDGAPPSIAPMAPTAPLERLPQPHLVPVPEGDPGGCGRIAPAQPLRDLLLQLRAERQALNDSFDAATRSHGEGVRVESDESLRRRMQDLLKRIEKPRAEEKGTIPDIKLPNVPWPEGPKIDKAPETLSLSLPAHPLSGSEGTPGPGPVDPLALAHALWRVGNYSGAAHAFRMIDLKGGAGRPARPDHVPHCHLSAPARQRGRGHGPLPRGSQHQGR